MNLVVWQLRCTILILAPRCSDYHGAQASGLRALLLRRPGLEGEEERKERDEDLTSVQVVPNLARVVEWAVQRAGQEKRS